MRKRSIGSLDVAVVGIGCNNVGRELDLAATRQIVHAALDEGITFFDIGDTYGRPRSNGETVLGEAIKSCRDRLVIATKFGHPIDEARRGAKAAYVRAATEASLRRLQTDYIDLMQLAVPDPTTPIEETLGALGELVKEGKIREIGGGGSNFSAEELKRFSDAARTIGAPHFVSTQTEFSVLDCKRAGGILAECARQGMKLLPNRPLFNGLLTGKYRPGMAIPADTRIARMLEGTYRPAGALPVGRIAAEQAQIMSPANFAMIAALTAYAESRGRTLLELAFGWLLAHAVVPCVFAGVTSVRQVLANAAAAGWELTAPEMAEIGELLEAA